jgi:hypothetical protein
MLDSNIKQSPASLYKSTRNDRYTAFLAYDMRLYIDIIGLINIQYRIEHCVLCPLSTIEIATNRFPEE